MKDIIVKAKNENTALNKVKSELINNEKINKEEVDNYNFNIKLEKSRKKYLLFGKNINYYKVSWENIKLNNLNKEKNNPENKSEEIKEGNRTTYFKDENDGEIKIKVIESGVFLKILPPTGKGDAVDYQTIKNRLDEKEIEAINWEKIKEELDNLTQKWIKIAPRKPELDREARVEIKISDDKLKAYLTYYPALGGKEISKKELYNIIEDKEIKYGLKKEKIKKVIQNKITEEKIIIAEGDPPEKGKDAKLIYHFDEKQNKVGTEKEDGKIDFYDLDLINNVKKGEKLVTLKKAEFGAEGKTVTGEKIKPPEPETKKLPSGKNVEKKDDKTLIAEIDGQVVKKRLKVNVLPVYKVNGDVDLNTGNIDFNGNVVVMGNVQEGFSVKAEGNIEIKGNVSGAILESGGEVVINKGFVGKDKGYIEADNNVKVKFVENASIVSKQDIIISDAVMHSRLEAGENIIVTKRKGLIVGGKIWAGDKIEANIVGSNFATQTELSVGIKPNSRKRYDELSEEIEEIENNLTKTKKALKILKEKENTDKLTAKEIINRDKLINTKQRLEKSLQQKRSEYEEIDNVIGDLHQGEIVVNKKLYSGVRININKASYKNFDKLETVRFFKREGEISYMNL